MARDARLVLGGVAPIPWRAPKAESFLRGKKIDDTVAQQAGVIALEGAKPLKDNVYKVKLAQDLVRRGLLEVGVTGPVIAAAAWRGTSDSMPGRFQRRRFQ